MWVKTGGKCWYCGEVLEGELWDIEHQHPQHRGGSNEIENLVPSCKPCNYEKKTKTVDEYRDYLGGVTFYGEGRVDDKWGRLEEIVRRVVREELEASRKPAKKYEPTIRLEGRLWVGISEDQMEAWKCAFPSVDVESELKRASAWILSNPSDAPKSQFARFLNSWFARQQNGHAMKASKVGVTSSENRAASPSRACGVCGGRANLQVNGEWRCVTHRFEEPPLLRMVK